MLYSWIYKKYDLYIENLLEPINNSKIKTSIFTNKYPDKIAKFLVLEGNNIMNYLDVEFNEIYTFPEFSDLNFSYFGEWANNNNELYMHGRGIFYFEPNFYYLGYFDRNKLNGYGRVHFNKKERFEIKFVNSLMEGEGVYYTHQNNQMKYIYLNGNFIKVISENGISPKNS